MKTYLLQLHRNHYLHRKCTSVAVTVTLLHILARKERTYYQTIEVNSTKQPACTA